MARKQTKSPNGWLNYRLNLLVLYDDVLARDATLADDRIAELFQETDYSETEDRPGFAIQWARLNEIEQRLFRLLDDTQLREEVRRKFNSAEKEGVPGVDERRADFKATFEIPDPDGERQRRAIATALLEDLFVRYSYRFSAREKRGEVSRRLTRLGLWFIGVPTLLIFLIPVVAAVVTTVHGEAGADTFYDRIIDVLFTSQDYAAFFVVMYFGAVGAYFSRLFIFARDIRILSWKEMDAAYSAGAIWVRLLVGAIAAVIVFFLMMGDILSGAMFIQGDFGLWIPAPCDDALPGEPFGCDMVPLRPTQDFARLVIWCTLSGFSERFLPDRFSELDERAKGSANRDEA